MKVGATRIWGTLSAAWRAAWSVPGKYKYLFLINPLDATRYLEFGYLLEFLDRQGGGPGAVLDVSSPVMISHILARRGYSVTKTDLNPAEARFVGDMSNPSFEVQDARCLSYPDDTFDLVVSISVIEHIHKEFTAAIREMIRVVRPGGHIYLTFPVAGEHREEWLDSDIYGAQVRDGEKVFFQYRFGPDQYRALREGLPDNVELVAADIFWERTDGLYDKIVNRLRKPLRSIVISHLRAAVWNLATGPFFFRPDPGDFGTACQFGNAQWVLKVKEGQVNR